MLSVGAQDYSCSFRVTSKNDWNIEMIIDINNSFRPFQGGHVNLREFTSDFDA